MEHLINPDGSRNRDFRPYIFGEETTYNTSLYDPSRSVNYGMYEFSTQPPPIYNSQDEKRYQRTFNGRERYDKSMTGKRIPCQYQTYGVGQGSSGSTGLYQRLYAFGSGV
jgi:hypothetical protein